MMEDKESKLADDLVKLADIYSKLKLNRKKCNCCNRNFQGYIYHCLRCPQYRLCSQCFNTRQVSDRHESNHPVVRCDEDFRGTIFGIKINSDQFNLATFKTLFAGKLHSNVTCDKCSCEPIKGLRFKCDICFDYDLCSKCYEERKVSKSHTFEHPMIVFGQTESLEIEKSNVELLGDPIGGGAFGVVYRAKLKSSNNIVACKIIKYDLIRFLLFGLNPVELVKSFVRELNAFNQIKVILNNFFCDLIIILIIFKFS